MADTTPTLREAAQRLLNAIEAVHEAEKSEGHARGGFVRTAPTRAHQRRVAEAWHENAAAVQALRAALAEQAAEQAVDREFELGVCESLDAAKALPDAPKDRWLIRFNNDGEFGCATGWLYRDGGEPCIVTGNPVYVWRPLGALLATTGHKIVREDAPAAEQAPHPSYPHITQPYTLEEIRAQIASHDYSAELLLQHAMLLLDDAEQAEPVAVPGELEKFEAWAKEYGRIFLAKKPKFGRDGVMYENQFTQEAWVGWQARASLSAAPPAPARQEPLTESQVDDLIHSKQFDRSYKLHASDETCLRWYRLGLRDGERAHGIVAATAEGGAA